MPEAIAALAHEIVEFIIHAGNPSRGSIAILMAVAANPAGQMNIGQVSPTRKVTDFQRKYANGTITAEGNKIANALPPGVSPPPLQGTPHHTHRRKIKTTPPHCCTQKKPRGH